MIHSITAEPRHPIQVVTRRTGLSADVLRAWERRYGAVTPSRTDSQRRLYSDGDIERLLLLKAATDAGRPIGQVAQWSDDQLQGLVREDREAEAQRSLKAAAAMQATASEGAEGFLDRALSAVHQLDGQGLQRALDAASLSLSPAGLTERVLVPLMRTLGDGWVDGRLGIAHEHLASAIVRNVLSGIVLSRNLPGGGPGIIVATPTRQIHELGALVVAATAASVGWRVTYLGSDLPANDIANAANGTEARAVALSITHPSDDPELPAQLRGLRESLAPDTVLILGGLSAAAYADVLTDQGSLLLGDVASLRAVLLSLRSENGGNGA
jgi:DNA-binding transcriptional MerR regulator/methylmalonyl-CoA mutase cobalamin-binding subunit